MKTHLMIALVLGCALGALAEEPAKPPGPPSDRPGFGPGRGMPGLKILTEEERERLRKAREQVRDSETVKASREELEAAAKKHRETIRTELLKIDPSLGVLLDKLEEHLRDRPKFGDRPGFGRPGRPGLRARGDGPPPGGGRGEGQRTNAVETTD